MSRKRKKAKVHVLVPGNMVRVEWRDARTLEYPERGDDVGWLMHGLTAGFYHGHDADHIRIVQTWFQDMDGSSEARNAICIPRSQVVSLTFRGTDEPCVLEDDAC